MFSFIIFKLFQSDSRDLLMLPIESQYFLVVIVSIKPAEYLPSFIDWIVQKIIANIEFYD